MCLHRPRSLRFGGPSQRQGFQSRRKPEVEIARILRYWAGALSQMGLAVGTDQVLMDSAYTPVGHLRVTE
jgi:hypothetical protein